MPLVTTLPVWFALDNSNDGSPSGFVDKRTGQPTYAGGLTLGDYFDLTDKEALSLTSREGPYPLYAGRYRRVQLDPAAPDHATTHTLGFMPPALVPELNIVTTANGVLSQAQLAGARVVVFLNHVDPGRYTYVQELGVATVILSSNAATAGGQAWIANMPVDGRVSIVQGTLPLPIGRFLTGANSPGPIRVALFLPVFQG
jgi:hypothetical protein